jgi:putative AlgH/UPF0301 family transcriptional regulator
VILLLDHQERGSYGIILNRPSVYRLGQLELTHPLKGRAQRAGVGRGIITFWLR